MRHCHFYEHSPGTVALQRQMSCLPYKNLPARKFITDWYKNVSDMSIYLLIAENFTDDCKVRIVLTIALTAHSWTESSARVLNISVTSVFTNG